MDVASKVSIDRTAIYRDIENETSKYINSIYRIERVLPFIPCHQSLPKEESGPTTPPPQTKKRHHRHLLLGIASNVSIYRTIIVDLSNFDIEKYRASITRTWYGFRVALHDPGIWGGLRTTEPKVSMRIEYRYSTYQSHLSFVGMYRIELDNRFELDHRSNSKIVSNSIIV